MPTFDFAEVSRSFFAPFFGEPLALSDMAPLDTWQPEHSSIVDIEPDVGDQFNMDDAPFEGQTLDEDNTQLQSPVSNSLDGVGISASGTRTPSDPDGIRPRNYFASAIEFDAQLIFPDLSKTNERDIDDEDFAHVEVLDTSVLKRVFDLVETLQSVDDALAPDFELTSLMRATELTVPLPLPEVQWEATSLSDRATSAHPASAYMEEDDLVHNANQS
ncbi:Hypothetical protein D9617_39g039090 [Elsinoe fawcettii]|nr:Hypothetical protein D9617_39g039090 [Elsinoe fawcettii]